MLVKVTVKEKSNGDNKHVKTYKALSPINQWLMLKYICNSNLIRK